MERRGRRQPPAIGSRPWIVYFTGQGETFCSIPSSPSEPPQIYHHKCIPELRDADIYGCCDGWLILGEDLEGQSLGFSLWSPSTSHSIHVPTLNLRPGEKMRACVLTSSPPPPPYDGDGCGCDCGCDRCGGCVLMVFIEMSPVIYFRRLRGGGRNWRQHWYRHAIVNAATDSDDSDDSDSDFNLKDENLNCFSLLRQPVACGGKVFACFGRCSRLAIVDVDDNGNNLSVTTYPDSFLPKSCNHLLFAPTNTSLIEWLGQVFSVQTIFGGIDSEEVLFVEVHKLDLSSMEWERVWRLGDVAFLLCRAFSISYPAAAAAGAETSNTGSLRAGHVYMFLKKDKRLYDCNIEDGGSLLVTLPCPNLPTPWAMPTWIVPHLRLNDVGGDRNNLGSIAYKHEEEIHAGEDKEDLGRVQRKCEANENGKGLLNLPVDVLYLIASHLAVFDYMNFQLACRKARELAPPVRWATVAVSLKTHCLSPWLMFPDKEKGAFTIIDPMFNQRYFLTIPEELAGAGICYSKGGWLLLRGTDDEGIFFYNPFTKVTYRSPKIPCGSFHACVCFSGKPGTPELAVVSILSLFKIEACFKWADEEEWKFHEFLGCTDFWTEQNKPVFYDEGYYCLSTKGILGVLRVSRTGNCSWEVLDRPQKPCGSFRQNFLVECNGELLSVFVGKLGSWVRVFKLKRAEMQWEEVRNLGKHMVFLSRFSSFSAVAKVPSMENKIYFPRFYGETSQDIVFYSLSTGKFQSHCGSHPTLEDFCGTREQFNCAWIEPSWVVHD